MRTRVDVSWLLRTFVADGLSATGAYRPLQALAGQLFGGFILAFHDMGGERFREVIQSLSPGEPVHLSELVDRLRRGKSTQGLFAITVDDGVRDTVQALSSVAQDLHWPVTFFLPTGYLDAPGGMAFQWLQTILARVPRVRLDLRAGVVDLSTELARQRFGHRVTARMYARPAAEYLGLIEELVSHAIARGWLSRERDAPPAPVAWKDVTALAAHPAIRFGSHGVTHIAAAALHPDQLERELRESQERISAHTGAPCRHFAYPFGGPESIGAVAPGLVAKYYDSAVTMSRGRLRNHSPFLLPRIPLYSRDSAPMAHLKLLTW